MPALEALLSRAGLLGVSNRIRQSFNGCSRPLFTISPQIPPDSDEVADVSPPPVDTRGANRDSWKRTPLGSS